MMKRVEISDWMKANLDKYKELSAEQEHELYERISLGDEEAVQELALSAWRFAAMEIERQCCDFLDGDDLMQDVIFGLMDAARQYIPSLGRFCNFASGSWIRMSVSNAIKKHEKTVRVTRYV